MKVSVRSTSCLAVVATIGVHCPVLVAEQTSCPGVCPDGSPVNEGLLLPEEPGTARTTTCGAIDAFAKAGVFPCEEAVNLAQFCECPNLPFECRVCPAGQTLPADKTAFDTSCELLADQQLFINDPESCSTDFHAQLKVLCGDCVPRNNIGDDSNQGSCTICLDGSPVSDARGLLPNSVSTCSGLELTVSPFDPVSCENAVVSDDNFLQIFCGCPGFDPTCTLCGDGGDPPLFDTVLPGGLTCGEFNSQILAANSTDCDGIGSLPIAAICGCSDPVVPAQNATCDICPGGNLTRPDATVPFLDISCSFVALVTAFGNETECAEAQNPFLQSVCGCTVANETVCTLCADGSFPSGPGFQIPGEEIDCDFLTLLALGLNDTECMDFQASGIGAICGCDIDGACAGICPDGGPIGFPDLVPFADEGSNDGNVTCGGLEFFVRITNDTEACSLVQSLYSEVCGCENPTEPSCTLCEDGSDPPFTNVEISPGLSCPDANNLFGFVVNNTECIGFQATAGVYCGCQNDMTSDLACRICGGTTLLPDPSRIAFLDEFDEPVVCGSLEFDATIMPENCIPMQVAFSGPCCAPFVCSGLCRDGGILSNTDLIVTIPDDGSGNPVDVSCSEIDMFLKTEVSEAEECFGLQREYEELCGCPMDPPPTTGCTICEDGSSVGLPDLVVSGDGGTCADLESIFADNTDLVECNGIQAVAGVYCGCNNPLTEGTACRICGDGVLLPDPGRLGLVVGDDEVISCGQLEYEATVDFSLCGSIRDEFAESCCVGLEPPVTMAPVVGTKKGKKRKKDKKKGKKKVNRKKGKKKKSGKQGKKGKKTMNGKKEKDGGKKHKKIGKQSKKDRKKGKKEKDGGKKDRRVGKKNKKEKDRKTTKGGGKKRN